MHDDFTSSAHVFDEMIPRHRGSNECVKNMSKNGDKKFYAVVIRSDSHVISARIKKLSFTFVLVSKNANGQHG